MTSSGAPEATGPFNPSRLALARLRRGLSKTELAQAIGVDLRAVWAFENGEYPPAHETMERIESALRFPRAFFHGATLDLPRPVAVSFRSMSKMTAAQRDTALGSGALAVLASRWLEQEFRLPQPQLPDLSHERNVEAAAIALREMWGCGVQPISNMVHLLESKGVRVFSLAIDAREVDAFSMWKETTPFVFLNTRKSAEHSRFDAAHELGHLVLHRHALEKSKDVEAVAHRFASAFLMPKADVLANAPRFPTLDGLIRLKRRWIVSLSALTRRLHDLEVLSDWQYRMLFREIAKKGYRIEEPNPATHETSQVFGKVLKSLRAEGIGRSDIVKRLALPEDELDNLMFGLVLTSLRGGGLAVDQNRAASPAQLRLVPNSERDEE